MGGTDLVQEQVRGQALERGQVPAQGRGRVQVQAQAPGLALPPAPELGLHQDKTDIKHADMRESCLKTQKGIMRVAPQIGPCQIKWRSRPYNASQGCSIKHLGPG